MKFCSTFVECPGGEIGNRTRLKIARRKAWEFESPPGHKMKPKIIAIVGPTASGKSDLAVSLAQKFNGEVISADSRQVYKGLDIGTGKITKKEMRGVPHYLLDVANPLSKPFAQFSVDKYKALADKAISEIISRRKIPILCGGTGFYIDAVSQNIVLPNVPPNPNLRKALSKKSPEQLLKMLQKIDPARAKSVEQKNKVRLIRAIEIARAIGKVPKMSADPQYDVLYVGTMWEPEILKERIRARLVKRIKGGMIEEARRLHQQGLSWKRMHELGLEYRYQALYLQKNPFIRSKQEMIEKLNTETWHYAKRQMTWFKRNKKIIWIEPRKIREISQIVKKFLG